MKFRGPHVEYLRGRVRCPFAEVGDRPADASNRLVVDDPATDVTIEGDTITIRDDRACASKTVVADLVWLAEGPQRFTIHVEIFKTGHAWSIDLHTHEPVALTDRKHARYEPFTIVGVDGDRREVLVDPTKLARTVQHIPLKRKLSGALTTTRDHPLSGNVLFDRSIGLGSLGLGMMLVRARLSHLGPRTPKLTDGDWELSLEVLTERWLPEIVARDLVLYGLAELPLLAELRKGNLKAGQTLAFRTTGEVRLDNEIAQLAGARDIARAYLEFHMLGGIIAAAVR